MMVAARVNFARVAFFHNFVPGEFSLNFPTYFRDQATLRNFAILKLCEDGLEEYSPGGRRGAQDTYRNLRLSDECRR